jgi:phosphate transport system protein
METDPYRDDEEVIKTSERASPLPVRHALRDQDALWDDFLAMGLAVVDSLSKSVAVLCEGRFDVVPEVKSLERNSDRADVRIEQECLRILALFEPVASDLRRLATILKVSRDWERIADRAARIARRVRKQSRKPDALPIPDPLKVLARDVLTQVCASFEALSGHDSARARAVIVGDRLIDRQYRQVRRELKESLRQHTGQLEAWLRLLNTARNLERIADYAAEIAQTVVYLQEGIIVRDKSDNFAISD